MRRKTRQIELSGTNYTIGYKLGELAEKKLILKRVLTSGMEGFTAEDVDAAQKLFSKWCPGINDELRGFADALSAPLEKITFYAMTYLKPRCSQITLLPSKTETQHVLMARNYEFNHKLDDFALIRTSVEGKYSHIGTSVLQFGRDEGMNECGLGVTMSSLGFPVGAMPEMRNPKIIGLQFWAVIRSLLENCANVKEALIYLREIPISYNLNLIVADKHGNAALFESLDGKSEVKQIDTSSSDQYLHATNHAHLKEIQKVEPVAMENSLIRYENIKDFINSKANISKDDIKDFLLSKYPDGLCCHYYNDFFGTTKSIVMDLTEGTMDICWAGLIENGWRTYNVNEPLAKSAPSVSISREKAPAELFEIKPIG